MTGRSVRLTVTGEIDMATAGHLSRALRDLLARRDLATILVDLEAVTFCDATGVQVLENAYALAGSAGIRLRLVHARGMVRTVLEITGSLGRLTAP